MKCQRCNSERVLGFNAKCSDMFSASVQEREFEGYVPHELGLGGGDYLEGHLCLDCGQLQGKFPKELQELDEDEDE